MKIELTEKEARNVYDLLDYCLSEDQMNYGSPAYKVMIKLKEFIDHMKLAEDSYENRAD